MRLPFKVTEGPDGGCQVHVTFCNEPASFSPEQLMAMVLVDLKKIAEAESGIAVTDCAISVPTFYTGKILLREEGSAMLWARGFCLAGLRKGLWGVGRFCVAGFCGGQGRQLRYRRPEPACSSSSSAVGVAYLGHTALCCAASRQG